MLGGQEPAVAWPGIPTPYLLPGYIYLFLHFYIIILQALQVYTTCEKGGLRALLTCNPPAPRQPSLLFLLPHGHSPARYALRPSLPGRHLELLLIPDLLQMG